MKKIFIMALLCALASYIKAQTNTFPDTGKVGIGTLFPTGKLTLAGSGNSNPNGGSEVDYYGLNLTFKGESNYENHNLGVIKMVQPHNYYIDASDMTFSTSLGSLSEKMRIKANGNLGIGTTSPRALLDIHYGTVLAGGDVPGTSVITGPNQPVYQGTLSLESNSSVAADQGGTLVFKGIYTGNAPAAYAAVGGLKENGIDGNYAGYLAFYTRTNGSYNIERMRISSVGYVGIGTSNPGATLDVNGNGNFSTGLTVGSNAAATNIFQQVLTNNYYGISGVSYPGQFRWYASPNNSLYKDNALYQLRSWDAGTGTENTILTYTGAGYVGIGTTSPTKALDINGSSLINGALSLKLTYSSDYSGAIALNRNADVGGIYNTAMSAFQINGRSTWMEIQAYNSSGYLTDANAFAVDNQGRVGISTSAPSSTFQVEEGCTKASIGEADGAALNYGTSYLGFNAARTSGVWVLNADSVHNGGGVIYSGIAGDMYFAAIPSTGTSTQALTDTALVHRIALHLAPNGIAYVKQINVQPSIFPDYVFKTDYPLMPLADVQTYINKNHHLPEIPSAEEVAKNGLNLGEINKLLVKKVEELTLYMIEKDKQVAAQQQQTNYLKNQLQTQSAELQEQREQMKKMALQLEALTKKIGN